MFPQLDILSENKQSFPDMNRFQREYLVDLVNVLSVCPQIKRCYLYILHPEVRRAIATLLPAVSYRSSK